MGFFRKLSDSGSGSGSSNEVSFLDFARGGKYGPGTNNPDRPITSIAFEYARGGSLHGLNRNPDGSPETIGQSMRREREETEREARFRR
jgi:hypothetical protein